MYDVNIVLEELKKETAKPHIRLDSVKVDCTQFDSKVGGVPYVPNDFEYPHSTTNGEPLRLLAQINFEQMPSLENFPTKGILQFYIPHNGDAEYMWGWDMEHPTIQSEFRVIFHKDVDYTANNSDKVPIFDDSEFIVKHECKLVPTLSDQGISADYDDFDGMLKKAFKSVYPSATDEDFDEFYSTEKENIWNSYTDYDETQMGGYPFFTQGDPREDDTYADYTTLLLQLDTDNTSGIMWGDAGVGNFFIKPEDLENLDFSDVLYYWDCY